jgi:hypothetical protein
VYRAIDRGELRPVTRDPIQVLASDVEALRLKKQDQAIERYGADQVLRLARDVRLHLHPPATAPGPRGSAALTSMSEQVKSVFGAAMLNAAALRDGEGCRWCAARIAGKMLGIPVSDGQLASRVGLALLGGPTCERDRGLVRAQMTELATRVHPGGVRPPEGRSAPSPGKRPPSPQQRAEQAVTAAKVGGRDDGKMLVQRRLRETRERLKAAKRRGGDPKYALRLAQQVRDLERDAARVDGRAVTAAARPGTLRCGHALAAGCACPRRASSRGQR